MAIAVSRATSLLRIVGVEKEMRKDQRLAELACDRICQTPLL
jgi:hypothetical protein